jgi:hypothetical protein
MMEDNNKLQDTQSNSSEPISSDTPDNTLSEKGSTNPYPGKSKGKLAAIIVIVLLAITGAATAFAFKGTLSNTFALMTKSPSEYYAHVEKKAFQNHANQLSPLMTQTADKQGAYDVTADVTFNKEALNSILQTTLGVSFTDLESTLGLTIDTIGMDALVAYDENLISNTMGVRLNNVNLITMEMFMDMIKEEIMLRFPELSQAYLSESMVTEGYNSKAYKDLQKQLTPKRITDLLNRYTDLAIDHAKNVTLEKDVTLSLETLTVNCNQLTVTLSKEDMNLILQDILMEAREDEFILDMLPAFAMTTEDYQSAIDEALVSLKESSDSLETSDNFIMVVSVDKQGNIIGREFGLSNSSAALSYTVLTKNKISEYNINYTDETDITLFNINGNQTKDQNAYDGKLTLEINAPSIPMLSNFSIDVTYDDLRTEFKNGVYYQYGNLSMSSLDLMGLQMNFEYGVENNIQNCNVDIRMGASSLVTIHTKQEYLEDYTITPPASTAEVYTTDQAESYLATMDIEQYITNLSQQLGVDLYSIYESLFGYSY